MRHCNRDFALRELLCSAAIAALLAGSASAATTDAGADATTADTVVVTASRIDRAGFEAPTPTTVISGADLTQAGSIAIGTVLDDLPQFRGTTGPTTTGTNTASASYTADLRGLGASRTLVLVNSHRYVGDDDLNSIPFIAIRSVDIVTGGASASWGSGAVSGVANIILSDKLEGVTVAAEGGESTYGDGARYRFGAAGGTSFADGAGHISIAGDYTHDDGIAPKTSRSYVDRYALFANPTYTPTNGQHQFSIVDNVNSAVFDNGGIITSGVLKGQTFNPNGSLSPFQYGSIVSGSNEVGGAGPSQSDYSPLSTPFNRGGVSINASYQITPTIRATADLLYSDVNNNYGFYPDAARDNITIHSDNAFLSSTIKQQLAAAGQTSFVFGREDADFGFVQFKNRRQVLQATFGLDGTFADNWRWNAYISSGENDINYVLSNMRVGTNFNNAVDSVISPTTGQPICRVALTNPSTTCIPIDLFGYGAPSKAAIASVMGAATSDSKQTLTVGGVSLRGEPFSLPAGAVSIAVGGEARREFQTISVDPISQANGFLLANFGNQRGGFNVAEGFAEVLAPLIKDQFLTKSLEFNGGARVSDYSNSGTIWSWKLGLSDQLNDDLRLRFDRSRDIRSPNLTELYTTQSTTITTISDPKNNTQPIVPAINGGNPNLHPEIANTYTVGGVYTPHWAPGLSISIDYYNINIAGAITTLTAQDLVTRCFNGNNALCSQIVRDANGVITTVYSNYINLAQFKTSGVDYEAAYVMPLDVISSKLPGRMRFRLLATDVMTLTNSDGVTETNSLGSLGANSTFGTPRWRGLVSAAYQNDGLNVDVRMRYIGDGYYNKAFDISNNAISARAFFDVDFDYALPFVKGPKVTIYGSVRNVFGQDPPILPNPAIYDVIGRYVTLGARASF